MSVIVMRKKFEAIPDSTDIMQLLFGQDSGDRDKAKDALQAFLAPVKDLLDLLYLVDQMKSTSERHIELLQEQEKIAKEISSNKTAANAAKAAYDKATALQTAKLEELSGKIVELEKAKTALEDAQAARDRLNTAMVAEIEAEKKALLVEVAKDVAKAKDKLITINASIEAAEAELSTLTEKKRQFIASLTA